MSKDLYILQMEKTGEIKVGRSKDPKRRLKQLQTGSPYLLKIILHAPGKGHLEKMIHRDMSHLRTRRKGEWFKPEALTELPIDLYDLLDLELENWWRRS